LLGSALFAEEQGIEDHYEFLSEQEALDWMLDMEEHRGPGCPEIGPSISMRFPRICLGRLTHWLVNATWSSGVHPSGRPSARLSEYVCAQRVWASMRPISPDQ
jgi:hypothetical protein